jgi:methionyl-tRNA formyltransferase
MGQEVAGIFSIPQDFRISWSSKPVRNVLFRNFEDLAQAHQVPLVYVTKRMADPEYRQVLTDLKPDILIVAGWYYLVPPSLRMLAPLGAVGIHGSLLPKYRGGAPLVWAMINGDTHAGVSLFYLADGVDDGDVIGQVPFDIDVQENIADVVGKATDASLDLLRQYVALLAMGKAPHRPQDHSAATMMPQRKPEDGLIDWCSLSALQAHNWVRAQTRPYPGAFTYFGKQKVIIWKAHLSRREPEGPCKPGAMKGPLPECPDALGVWCADHRLICVHEVGLEDGTAMSGMEFATSRAAGRTTVLGGLEGVSLPADARDA